MFRLLSQNLASKLTAMVVVLCLSSAALMTGVGLFQSQKSLTRIETSVSDIMEANAQSLIATRKQATNDKIGLLIDILADTSKDALVSYNADALDRSVTAALSDPDIVGVRFITADGIELSTGGESVDGDGFVTVSRDIEQDGFALGQIVLTMTLAPLQAISDEAALALQREKVAFSGKTRATKEATINSSLLSAGLVAAAFAFAAFIFVQRMIGTPLRDSIAALSRIKSGDLSMDQADAKPRRDEIGSLRQAINAYRDATIKARDMEDQARKQAKEQHGVVAELKASLTRLADGDLTAEIKDPFPDGYDQLRADFNAALSALNAALGSVVEGASGVREDANSISSAATSLAQRSEASAGALEDTSRAVQNLSIAADKSAHSAMRVRDGVSSAQTSVQNCAQVMDQAIASIRELATSSDEISQIITVINDISYQTNLLALNAGVEAARAGEAGKGFAVVATEVRALSVRCAKAANSIGSLIDQSRGAVDASVQNVNATSVALDAISKTIDGAVTDVCEISDAAQTQSQDINALSGSITQIDEATQQNAAMFEETSAALESMLLETKRLTSLMKKFNINALLPSTTAQGGMRYSA